MKTKKGGIYIAISAVLLITALLVSGCFDPIGKFGMPENILIQDVSPPPANIEGDKVILRISLTDPNARTIMPDVELNDFINYDVIITGGADAPPARNGITYTALTTSDITLNIGQSYNITVNAYLAYNPADLPSNVIAATWNDPAFAVIATTTTITVSLKEIDNNGEGTFQWDLSYITGGSAFTALGTATLDVFDITDDTFQDSVLENEEFIDLKTDPTGSQNIPSGFYRVITTLTQANHQTIVITEILHIYRGMTSIYTETFTALNSTLYTITLNYNHGATPHLNTATTVSHGGTLAQPSFAQDAAGARAGWAIIAWTRDAGGLGTPAFEWDDTQVWRPLTFYAQWEETSVDVTVEVSFNIANIDASLVLTNPTIQISQDYLEADGTYTISLAAIEGIDPAKTTWSFGGGAVSRTGASLVITNADMMHIQQPTLIISAEMWITGTDLIERPYSRNFNITVID